MREQQATTETLLDAARRADGALYTAPMVAILAAGSTFGFSSSVFNLLPKYLVEVLGAGPAQIGMVTATFGAATVAVCPLLARWIDRMPRGHFVRLGALLMIVTSLAFSYVDEFDVLLIVLRAVQGAAFGLTFTALTTLVADVAPAKRLSEALGLVGASMLITNAIAPAVVEPLAAGYGWTPAFVLAAVLAGASLVIGGFLDAHPHARDRGGVPMDAAEPRTSGRTLHYAIITASVGCAFGVMFTYHQPFALSLGRANVSGFFVSYCVAALVARLALGRLTDRIGRFRVAVVALHLYTLVVLATAAMQPGLLEAYGALLGLSHGMFFPAFNALAIAGASPSGRGRLLTVFTAAFYGGFAAGVLVLGALAEHGGYPIVFAATAATTFTASGLLVFSRAFLVEAQPTSTGHPIEVVSVGPVDETCASKGAT